MENPHVLTYMSDTFIRVYIEYVLYDVDVCTWRLSWLDDMDML